MRASAITVSAIEQENKERQVVIIVDGAADLRFPFL